MRWLTCGSAWRRSEQLVRARTTLGEEGHRQIERLRAELRAARREFRLARSRWRAFVEELTALPVPAVALATVA